MKPKKTTYKIDKKITKTEPFDSISCKKCKNKFGINKKYMGVITCPYCGEYVEG